MARPGTSVRIENLTISYDRIPALQHVDASFAAGSLTAVAGPNGAGKSTLVKAIAGIQRPAAGRVDLGALPRGRLAYLPQLPEIDRSFPISVLDTVLLGLWRRLGWFRAAGPADLAAARGALHQVGLDGFEGRAVGALSVGQFQRVLFARLMVQDAPLILLDEPFAALDTATTAELLGLVGSWHREGRTVIAVLHDLDQIRAHFPETLLLARSVIAAGPTAATLSADHLARARWIEETWDDRESRDWAGAI